MAPLAGDTGEALLEAADLALYQAKHDGGGCYRFYDTGLKQIAPGAARPAARPARGDRREEHRAGLPADRGRADPRHTRLRGTGTLGAARTADRFSPDRFIRLAEEAGLIEELGDWILGHACAEAATWQEMLKVAVNISVGQLGGRGLHPARRRDPAPHRARAAPAGGGDHRKHLHGCRHLELRRA